MKKSCVFLLTFCSLLFWACKTDKASSATEAGDTLHLEYARLLHVVKYPHFTTVTIDNPWHEGHVLHRYVLVRRGEQRPDALPKGTVIEVPVRKTVMFTTTHCFLFGLFNCQDRVAGACDTQYILLPWVKEKLAKGEMADCGNGLDPLVEKIIDLGPDMMFLSPFENSGGYGKIEEIGTPYFECAEYMECSALARAEWMKVYGMLLGKEAEADSLFDDVRKNYRKWMGVAQSSKLRRSIITEKLTGSTWYVAGGKSSVGRLIADAQGDYAFSGDNHAGSLALPFEAVLDKAGDADVWIFNYNDKSRRLTYPMLEAEYRGYSQMKAFRERQVWYVNTLSVPYFEEVSFHPDYLLRDYIILLHPDLQLGALRYYQPLDE
jgi:iron complex transport system substrate-binding protein